MSVETDIDTVRSCSRPWGYWEVLHVEQGAKVKRIILAPGKSISLQKHEHRSELQGEFSLRWPDGFDVDEKTFLCNDRRLFGKPISHSGGGYDFVGNKIVVWLNS